MNNPTVASRLRSPSLREAILGGALLLAVALAYLPVVHAGYIWDDDNLLTANPSIVGTRGLGAVWTTKAADICPLTITALWAMHHLWGSAPLPYHLTNVLLHGLNAVLLWRVLGRLRMPGAWLGAALWALHPVQVESVAWISEMKNTLSGVFYLLAILFFFRWMDPGPAGARPGAGWSRYAPALLCAALAMAAKTSTMVMPAVLCLAAWWVDGRLRGRRLLEIAPVFLFSLAAVLLSVWTQLRQQTEVGNDAAWVRSGPQRLAAAGDALWFYLGKLAWPHPLMTVYPRWEINAGRPSVYLPLAAAVIVGSALWFFSRRSAAAWAGLLAFGYFVTALLPVLGVVEISYFRLSFVADHFLYLAGMGPLALVGAGTALLPRGASPAWRPLAGAGLLLVLGTATWQRTEVYRSPERLWRDALAKNPRCWAAYESLGRSAELQGQPDEAVGLYLKALEINPDDVESCNNLGNVLLQIGKSDEALRWYRSAVRLAPNDPKSRNNLGNGLLQQNRIDDAILQYREALRIDPRDATAHSDLGNAFLQKGRVDDAVEQYRLALAINPAPATVHGNLGAALYQRGKADEAISQFQEAIKLNAHDAMIRYDLGVALFGQGRTGEAIVQYQEALKITPRDANLHNNLGNAFARQEHLDAAIREYRAALSIQPDFFLARRNLGAALAASGLPDAAVPEYQAAVKLRPDDAKVHRDLGDAYAAGGEAAEAIVQYREAVRLKPDDAEARERLEHIK